MSPPTYDKSNLFAKILKGEIPSHKVFETEHALAILDAFPVCDGHALLLPKAPCVSLLDMSPAVASAFLAELPRLGRIVRAATGAPSVKVVQNSGAEAGQVVFHCHFHVIPRWETSASMDSSKEMLSADRAKPMLAKMHAADKADAKGEGAYAATFRALETLMGEMRAGAVGPPKPKVEEAKGGGKDAKAAKAAEAKAKAAEAKAKGGKPEDKGAAKGQDKKAGGEAKPAEAKPKADKPKDAKPKEAKGGGGKGGDEAARAIDISWAELRVGRILEASPQPDSDKLYLEVIDLGEGSPRQVLSGLQQHMKVDQVQGALVVCICNLKARKIAGTESQAMVLCASDASKSNLCFVTPPAGSVPGELVSWGAAYPGEFEVAKKMDKKKAWESIQPLLATDANGTCVYNGAAGVTPFTLKGGVCTASVTGGIIS